MPEMKEKEREGGWADAPSARRRCAALPRRRPAVIFVGGPLLRYIHPAPFFLLPSFFSKKIENLVCFAEKT